jgi:hypothetical protein
VNVRDGNKKVQFIVKPTHKNLNENNKFLSMEEGHVQNKNGSKKIWYTTTILGSFTISKA